MGLSIVLINAPFPRIPLSKIALHASRYRADSNTLLASAGGGCVVAYSLNSDSTYSC